MGVAKRDVILLPPIFVRLDGTGGEIPPGRRIACLGVGDGEKVAMFAFLFNIQCCS